MQISQFFEQIRCNVNFDFLVVKFQHKVIRAVIDFKVYKLVSAMFFKHVGEGSTRFVSQMCDGNANGNFVIIMFKCCGQQLNV